MPEVIGAIRDKWLSLGGAGSFLGQPVTNEEDFSENGRFSVFQGGAIYWWPDAGAHAMGDSFVHYTGMNCFSSTSGPGSDEPYAVIGVSVPGLPPQAFRTQIHGDVDGGDTRPEMILLYQGQPKGMVITYQLMERDQGDPERYRASMQGVAESVTKAAAAGVKFIPVLGPILSPAAGPLLSLLNGPIADGLETLLGLGDDEIGQGSVVLSAKEQILMYGRPNGLDKNVAFKIMTPHLTGEGGNYKMYFGGIFTPNAVL